MLPVPYITPSVSPPPPRGGLPFNSSLINFRNSGPASISIPIDHAETAKTKSGRIKEAQT